MNDKIHGLVKTINNSINKNEKLFITRFKKDKNKQMFLRDIILYSSKLIHTFSYQNVTTDFVIKLKIFHIEYTKNELFRFF